MPFFSTTSFTRARVDRRAEVRLAGQAPIGREIDHDGLAFGLQLGDRLGRERLPWIEVLHRAEIRERQPADHGGGGDADGPLAELLADIFIDRARGR